MDTEPSQQAGRLLGESDSSVGKSDAAVAAAAEPEGEPVLTRNLEDFEKLGVAVGSY